MSVAGRGCSRRLNRAILAKPGGECGQRQRRAASALVGGTPRRTIPEQIPPRVPRDTVNLGQFRAISDQFRSEVRRRRVWVMSTISTS
jgi:hypothetical protein